MAQIYETFRPPLDETVFGRTKELELLKKIGDGSLFDRAATPEQEASILVVYGRRRVGKTSVIEHAYKDRGLLKFEGFENKDEDFQRKCVIRKLYEYTRDPLLDNYQTQSWQDVFKAIFKYVQSGRWSLYFEEVQWLADYKDDFISELKYYWDNYFRGNRELLIILCGSSPSFMINQVMHSKALYNRSQYEIALKPLALKDAHELLGEKRSLEEVLDAYLTLDGIPEYLKRIRKESSLFLGIVKQAFTAQGFFVKEINRIFISSFAENQNYKKILEYLSVRKTASREELLKQIGVKGGGNFSNILEDLKLCGFIDVYSSVESNAKRRGVRYQIVDSYLNFYHQFIKPLIDRIAAGDFDEDPLKAIKDDSYRKWLGLCFERFCRKNSGLIAKRLGFSGVNYKSGVFMQRGGKVDADAEKEQEGDESSSDKSNSAVDDSTVSDANASVGIGAQVDLVFLRDDKVITACEIKYTDSPIGTEVIVEFEKKVAALKNRFGHRRTIHKVLITLSGVDAALEKRRYFDEVLGIRDLYPRQLNLSQKSEF